MLDAVAAVRQMGCVVEAVISILDREAGAAKKFEDAKVRYLPLVTLSAVPKLVAARDHEAGKGS